MKNITQHTGKLSIISRLPSSINGNPRYLIQVDGWTCRTRVDCSIGYEITNFEGRQVKATIGTHYGLTTLRTLQASQ